MAQTPTPPPVQGSVLTPEDARRRIYLTAYALGELGRATEVTGDTGLSSTLEILSEVLMDAAGVIHPYIPGTTPPDGRPRTE